MRRYLDTGNSTHKSMDVGQYGTNSGNTNATSWTGSEGVWGKNPEK